MNSPLLQIRFNPLAKPMGGPVYKNLALVRLVLALFLCASGILKSHCATERETGKSASTSSSQGGGVIKNTTTQEKLDEFLEPERGLNVEIKTGLRKIDQVCQGIKKSTSNSNANSTINTSTVDKKTVSTVSTASIVPQITQARELLKAQSSSFEKSLLDYKTTNQINDPNNSCEKLPSFLRMSSQCKAYQSSVETFELITKTAHNYYSEISDRYQSYEYASQLEERGCARPQFSTRLWQAESEHMIPRLANSSQFFINLLQ